MFGLFKKKDKEENMAKTNDELEIEKAKADVADDNSETQTKEDEINESVGEQERQDGDENSQNAKDRIHESEATEKADEEGAEDDDDGADKHEEKDDGGDEKSAHELLLADIRNVIVEEVTRIVTSVVTEAMHNASQERADREPAEVSHDEADALSAVRGIYN